ncbi:hypothetical protein FTX61_16030 [Nitriliruptoraceae bacterium ZYF776]|nr:hypothetical protein [Profundirhabdus halotolerans]
MVAPISALWYQAPPLGLSRACARLVVRRQGPVPARPGAPPVARSARRDDEDALDPVEAADVEADDADEEDLPLDEEDAFEDDDEDDDASDDEDGDGAALEDAELPDEGADDEAPALPVPVAFDDEEDETIVAAVAGEDDDDAVDGLRDGEFVCRSCYMAKLESQLADPDRLLCRDCA